MANAYKGAISFGLVYIPITLSTSVKDNDIGFNMLDKKTMSRIKYKKTCVDCNNKEVKNEDIIKGYQYENDKYVIFTDEDFEKIKTERDKDITILEFVNLSEVDPVYFDKSYYVLPIGGQKAFTVLLEAMEIMKKAGLAKTVIGTKETLLLLRANNGKMLASTLFFNDEIQDSPEFQPPKTQKKELDLAINLIDEMTEKFQPEKYKDEYNEKLKQAIEQKISGKKIVSNKTKRSPAKVLDLMEALKKSLGSDVSSNKKQKEVTKNGRLKGVQQKKKVR